MQNTVLLKLSHITKHFPGIKALDDVHLTLKQGQIHALIGENGAGKSTLVKILTGIYTPTSGTIEYCGKKVSFSNAIESQEAGIVAIHQEASMFPELSVAENIYMGHHLRHGAFGKLDWKTMKQKTAELLERMQLDINPETLVKNLSVAQRHMVEITKALSLNANIVIMDEPTSALTSKEVEDLYRIIRKLKADGKTILFISHKFEEIFEICDYYTVLRDGQYIGEGNIKDINEDDLIKMMIGRSIDTLYPIRKSNIGKTVLDVKNLAQLGAFSNVSFSLHEGEVLGFFGLVGAGRSEVVRTIFGIDSAAKGTIFFDGKVFHPKSPKYAMKKGIALVPEDRQNQGLILGLSLTKNISLPKINEFIKKIFVNKKEEKEYVLRHGNEMEIKAAGYDVEAQTLSGGNQQKVVLAKWIGTAPKVLILDEPTKGIDVATKAAVHEFIAKMASNGVAIILISSELPEVMGLSDNVVVMHEGNVTGFISKDEMTPENIMKCAIGGVK